jgi:hypothetical protein
VPLAAPLLPVEPGRSALCGEGASWLGTHRQAAFPTGKAMLASYPCSERVHPVAPLHYADHNQQASWSAAARARLNCGEGARVLWGRHRRTPASLAAEAERRKVIGYWQTHAPRRNSRACKRGQYPQGSGGIEAATKCICHVRRNRSGAWWSVSKGNTMLRLRCAVSNETFDEGFARYQRLRKSPSTGIAPCVLFLPLQLRLCWNSWTPGPEPVRLIGVSLLLTALVIRHQGCRGCPSTEVCDSRGVSADTTCAIEKTGMRAHKSC